MTCHLFLNGCNGRMGRTIREIASGRDDIRIAAGSDLAADPTAPFPIYTDPAACRDPFDVLVDFSSPAALPRLFNLIEQPFSSVRDLHDRHRTKFAGASPAAVRAAPMTLASANMSLGVNLLIDLAMSCPTTLSTALTSGNIEPATTTRKSTRRRHRLMIADQLNQALDGALHLVTDRSQVRQKRQAGELGIHAVRGGTIVGELCSTVRQKLNKSDPPGAKSLPFSPQCLATALFLAASDWHVLHGRHRGRTWRR